MGLGGKLVGKRLDEEIEDRIGEIKADEERNDEPSQAINQPPPQLDQMLHERHRLVGWRSVGHPTLCSQDFGGVAGAGSNSASARTSATPGSAAGIASTKIGSFDSSEGGTSRGASADPTRSSIGAGNAGGAAAEGSLSASRSSERATFPPGSIECSSSPEKSVETSFSRAAFISWSSASRAISSTPDWNSRASERAFCANCMKTLTTFGRSLGPMTIKPTTAMSR